jgi:prolyl 4-hydroxylase
MIYLNDVPKGGTTEFKKLKEECVPKKGRAVVWSSLNEDGSIDHDTLHCGTPVLEGEKWITTTWFLDTEH